MSQAPETERELTIVREFDVPARYLFAAFSKPEHISRWFGPVGWPITLCEMDFRVGGAWRFAMTGPSGEQNTPFGGHYREIEPNRRLTFDNGFETPDSPRMVFTYTFDEQDGRTTLTQHIRFDTAAMKTEYVGVGMREGIASGFDQLADVAAELAAEG
jgi:uncharacterized protein YndB with AHSA1/START domain